MSPLQRLTQLAAVGPLTDAEHGVIERLIARIEERREVADDEARDNLRMRRRRAREWRDPRAVLAAWSPFMTESRALDVAELARLRDQLRETGQ